MGVAEKQRSADGLSSALAGLQAGLLAALWMLAWLGVSGSWQRSSFWTAENLLASTFFGTDAIRSGFSASTFSGIALYMLIYSTLGCLFAVVVRNRLPHPQLLIAGILFGLAWYFISFHGLWKTLSPLVTLLHAERPTILGHVLYGAILARYPRYLQLESDSEEPPSAGHSDSTVAVADSE